MTTYVLPGHTYDLKGTFAQTGILVADAGTPHKSGSVIKVRSKSTNLGTIDLNGGTGAGIGGATLTDSGVLTNGGIINVAGGYSSGTGGQLLVSYSLINNGSITVAQGSSGAGGQLTILASGSLTNTSQITLHGSASAAAGGATLVDAGVLTNQHLITVGGGNPTTAGTGALLSVTGTLVNDSSVLVAGARFSAGDNSGSGILNVSGVLQNSGEVLLTSALYGTSGGMLTDSGTITNTGSIIANGGGSSPTRFDFGSTIDITGVLTNSALLSLNPGLAGGIYGPSGDGAQLIDAGVLTNNGTLQVQGSGYADRAATVSVSGTLTNAGSIVTGAAALVVVAAGGTLASTGQVLVSGGDTIGGTKSIPGSPDGRLNVVGAMTNSGTVDLGGGVMGLNPTYNSGFYGAVGAQMTASGTFTNSGELLVGGGIGGSGAVFGTGATLTASGVVINQGSIELQAGIANGGYYGTGAELIDSGSLSNSGVISLDAGTAPGSLIITAAGTLTDSGTLAGGGLVLNDGLIVSGPTAGGLIAATTFINDGTISVALGSSFTVTSSVGADTGSAGVFDVAAQSTLTLSGMISASQTVALISHQVTLSLGNAMTFAGTIDGLAPKDFIDFQHLAVVSATPDASMLDIGLANGTTFDLALGAPLTDVSFVFRSDGSGGTDLLVHPAGSTPASSAPLYLGTDSSIASQAPIHGETMLHLPF